MTTIAPPINHAQTKGDFGFNYVFAARQALRRLEDLLDPVALGLASLEGDVAGTGSDTLRITNYGNIGIAKRMDALSGEDDAITPSSIVTGYSSITIGIYGLGYKTTWFGEMLARDKAIFLESIMDQMPESWVATVRYLLGQVCAGFGTAIGSASTELSVDDWIALQAAYRTNHGSLRMGVPTAMLHSQQIEQLLKSFRNDPAFQNSTGDFARLMAIAQGGASAQVYPNIGEMGMNAVASDDITTSGGGYLGGAWSRGGVGWGRASTGSLQTGTMESTRLLPEAGLVLTKIPGASANGSNQAEARAHIGVAAGASEVFVQRQVVSTT